MSWSRSTSRRATSTVAAEEANHSKPPPRRSGSMRSAETNDGMESFGVSCRTESMSNAKTKVPMAGRRRSSESSDHAEQTLHEFGMVDNGGRGNAHSRRASSGRNGDGKCAI